MSDVLVRQARAMGLWCLLLVLSTPPVLVSVVVMYSMGWVLLPVVLSCLLLLSVLLFLACLRERARNLSRLYYRLRVDTCGNIIVETARLHMRIAVLSSRGDALYANGDPILVRRDQAVKEARRAARLQGFLED